MLTNTSDLDLYYTGYTKEIVVVKVETLTKSGEWKDEFIGYCGNGLNQYRLGARTSTKIQGYGPPTSGGKTWRMGVVVSSEKDMSENYEVVWSNPIDPPHNNTIEQTGER